MFKNKKGQMFVALIVFGLAALIFIFAAPMLYQIVTIGASQTGTATAFVMRGFVWVVGIIIIGVFFKIISSGGSFV